MEDGTTLDYDEGLESADPLESDSDLGDALSDGTSNTATFSGPNR